MTITQYRKEINPVYDTIGKRRRLVGYRAQLFEGNEMLYDWDHSTHHDAEVALDQRVYDLLNDQPPIADEPTQPDLATDLYNVVCLTLSGAAATTAISELRRVQKRYEREVRK